VSSGDSGNSFFQDIVNVTTQVATGGLVGYGDNQGGFSVGEGVTGRVVKSALKDITGATAAEEANADARSRFEEQKAQALKAQQDAKRQNARDALVAARSAQAARGNTKGQTSTTGSQVSNLGSEERDFLGL